MTDPRPVPLDTAPLAEVVDRVLARHPAATTVRADAAGIAATADLVCSRFAAGGRLLLLTPDPATAELARACEHRLTHEFGFADGAVHVATDAAGLRPTPRDVVLLVTPEPSGAVAAGSAGSAVVHAPTPADAEAALDAVATAAAAQLGHLYGDLPVDLVAESDADRERVVAMVAEIAGVDGDTARRAAEAAGHDVRVAVLACVGLTEAEATTLAANRRTLRDALAHLPRRAPVPTQRACPPGGPASSGGG